MKKTYSLNLEGKNRDRLLDAAKHDIRKYVKRERAKALPAGVDFWDFDCRFGPTEDAAQTAHLAELTKLIDAVVQSGGTQFYVEILAKHGVRKARDPSEAPTAGDFLDE